MARIYFPTGDLTRCTPICRLLIYTSKSLESLLYGSIAGTICIWAMTYMERVTKDGNLTSVFYAEGRLKTSRPLMSIELSLEMFIHGIKSLVDAFLILLLAWTVGDSFMQCI